MKEKILPIDFDIDGRFPQLSRRLRLGIVGGGRISVTQSIAAQMSNYWEVSAGALSSNPEVAKERGAMWYLPEDRCYTSFEEMAQCEAGREDGIDAVMITTPNHLHYSVAKTFLEAGISVLCDKPLTNDVDEADMLVSLVKKSGRIFAVGYVMSCFPMVRQAKEIVSSGVLGELCQIHVEFMQDWMVPDDSSEVAYVKWRLDPNKSGKTSCVGDIGTHAAHLSNYITGLQMSDVRAEFHVCGAPKELEDTAFMCTRYNETVHGTLMCTRLASGNRGGLKIRIFGRKGGLEWNLENPELLKLSIYGEPDKILSRGHGHGISPKVERMLRLGRGFPEGLIEAWANLYIEFGIAVALHKDEKNVDLNSFYFPKIEEGAFGVKFIEATVKSNEEGGLWKKI